MITQTMIKNNTIACDYIDIIEDTNMHRKFGGDSSYLLYRDDDKLIIGDSNSGNIYYWPLMNIRSFTCHPVRED